MSSSSPSDEALRRAEELLADRLAEEDEAFDLEALCGDHPELEHALRELAASWSWLEGTLEHASAEAATRAASRGVLEALANDGTSEPYHTLDEIAQGGMGTVFKVWDPRLKRELAMKVSAARLHGSRAQGGSSRTNSLPVYRFLEEAQVMAQLDHPGVVPVHDIGLDEHGYLRFTMRLVQGQDLKAVLELLRTGSGGWKRNRVLEVLIKVCETVAYAHSKLVVHRDLKPSNVMVGRFGEVYVMDWGLARVLGRPDTRRAELLTRSGATRALMTERSHPVDVEEGLKTQEGAVVGTPAYMPPEQARGELDEVGTRSDVYAVGAMLYHLIARRAPYADLASGGAELVAAVCDRAPTPLRTLAPDAPAELVAVCEKAMARRVEDRYAELLTLGEDLRAFLEQRPVSALDAGAWTHSRKWLARNRLAGWALAATFVAVVAGVAAFASVRASRAQQTGALRDELDAAVATAEREARAREQAERRARLATYAARLAGAQAALRRPAIAREHLASCPPELRGFEWRHLERRVDGSLRVLTEPGLGHVREVVFGPEGRLVYAACGRRSDLVAWEVETGALAEPFVGQGGGLRSVAVGPDWRWIAAGGWDGLVQVWDPRTRERLHAWRAGAKETLVVAHPRDDVLVTCTQESPTARVWSVPGGDLLAELEHAAGVDAIDLDPDGGRLVTTALDGALTVWNLGTGERAASRRVEGRSYLHGWPATFSSDGERVVHGTFAGTIGVVDAVTLATIAELEAHSGVVHSLHVAGDGTLYSSANDGTVRAWSLDDGRPLRTWRGSGPPPHGVAVRGGTVASGDASGSVRLWNVDGPRAAVRRFDHESLVHAGAVHADRLVTAEEDGVVLRDVLTGEQVWKRDDLDLAFDVGWSRDGAVVAVSTSDGDVAALDPATGATTMAFPSHAGWTLVSVGSRGSLVASGGDQGVVRVCQVADGAVARTLRLGSAVRSLEFHPERRLLAVGCHDGTLTVADLDRDEDPRTIPAYAGQWVTLAFDADGGRLATAGRTSAAAVVWNTGTWEPELRIEELPDRVLALAFSADGTRLAVAGDDAAVRLHDTATGVRLMSLVGMGGWVRDVAFGPEDAWLVAFADGRASLWEAR